MDFFLCKTCKEMKPRDEFYVDKKRKFYIKSDCKECMKKKIKKRIKKKDSFEEKLENYARKRRKIEEEKEKQEKKENQGKSNNETQDPITEEEENSYQRKKIPGTYPFFRIEEEWEPLKNYSVIIDASRGSGKTALIRALFPYWKGIYDIILFFCQNPQSRHYDWLPDDYKEKWVFSQWNPEIIKILEKFQIETKNALRILIIGDDIVSAANKASETLRQVFLRGRNINMSIVIATQTPMLIEKNSRGNTDIYIAGEHHGPELKESAIRTFISGCVPLPEELQFKNRSAKYHYLSNWLDQNTSEHWFIVINYNKRDKIMEWNRDYYISEDKKDTYIEPTEKEKLKEYIELPPEEPPI